MNSPLARHLTRFNSGPPAAILASVQEIRQPQVTLSVAEFEEQLDVVREHARAEALASGEQQIAALEAERDDAVERALAAARAQWAADQAATLSASCEAALAALRELMCARLADVLRPLLADVAVGRAVAGLAEMLDRLLADPSHPPIKVRGPGDLVEALKAARSDATGIEYEASDGIEITMTAEGSYVETQIAAAFAALSMEALS